MRMVSRGRASGGGRAPALRRRCRAGPRAPPDLELLEEPEIVLEIEAQVVDAVAQHGHALHSHAEGEPGHPARVEPDVLEQLRMDHPGAEHLQPPRLLAGAAALAVLPARTAADGAGDVHLCPGLHEGKVAGAEARLRARPEVGPREGGERALQIREGDPLVHAQPLDLVEHGRVRLVVVGPVDAPGADDTDRRLPGALHGADLYRRGVRAQHDGAGLYLPGERGLLDVEGVLHVSGRVIARDVDRLEVVPVELDLRPARHLVPEPAHDGGDLVGGARDGVPMPARQQAPAWQRDVEGGALELRLELGCRQASPGALEERLDLVADPVRGLAHLGALLGRELPPTAQHRGDLALLAEEADPESFQRALVGGGADLLPRCLPERRELPEEIGHQNASLRSASSSTAASPQELSYGSSSTAAPRKLLARSRPFRLLAAGLQHAAHPARTCSFTALRPTRCGLAGGGAACSLMLRPRPGQPSPPPRNLRARTARGPRGSCGRATRPPS